MGVKKKVYTCDCCGQEIGKDIGSERYFYKIPLYYYFSDGSIQKYQIHIICYDCMEKAGELAAEKHRLDNIEFTVKQKGNYYEQMFQLWIYVG